MLHRALVPKYKMKTVVEQYYKRKLEKVLKNDRDKVYWDRAIMTDHTVTAYRPDIAATEKSTGRIFLIDVAVPNTINIRTLHSGGALASRFTNTLLLRHHNN